MLKSKLISNLIVLSIALIISLSHYVLTANPVTTATVWLGFKSGLCLSDSACASVMFAKQFPTIGKYKNTDYDYDADYCNTAPHSTAPLTFTKTVDYNCYSLSGFYCFGGSASFKSFKTYCRRIISKTNRFLSFELVGKFLTELNCAGKNIYDAHFAYAADFNPTTILTKNSGVLASMCPLICKDNNLNILTYFITDTSDVYSAPNQCDSSKSYDDLILDIL